MTRLADVARQAGVSVSTASVVLNPRPNGPAVSAERSARVREAARELGYIPNYHARTMRTGRAMTIAFALDTGATGNVPDTRLGSSFFSMIVAGVEAMASSRGYSTALFGAVSEKRRALDEAAEAVQQRRVDGIVAPAMLAEDVIRRMMARRVDRPIVLIDWLGRSRYPVVEWDETAAVDLALDHLAKLGHRELLWLGPPPRYGDAAVRRQTLFMKAVLHLGLSARCIHAPNFGSQEHASDLSRRERSILSAGRALGDYLSSCDRPKFTAIICFNDLMALGALGALRDAGVEVPRHVSVTGFDDLEAIYALPRLTTITREMPALGQRAAEVLIDWIEHPDRGRPADGMREVVAPRLIVRDSTGPATGTGI